MLSGTPRDSLHMIDVLYSQDGGRTPEVIITDTGSYSDIVFALIHLLGRKFRPALADLPDQKLWRFDATADYEALNTAARGKIDTASIVRHWPDVLRVVASIHTGAVRAHDVIRMLQRDGHALAHYGRIFKSLHVLTYVDDEPYRRDIKAIRTLPSPSWSRTMRRTSPVRTSSSTAASWERRPSGCAFDSHTTVVAGPPLCRLGQPVGRGSGAPPRASVLHDVRTRDRGYRRM